MPPTNLQLFLTDLRTKHAPARLLGFTIDTIPLEPLAKGLLRWLEQADAPLHIVTINPEIMERALGEPELLRLIQSAEVIVPDGVGIKWAVKQLSGRQIATVPGIDLAYRLLELSTQRGWEIFLLGGSPGVAAKASERLSARIRGLKVIGTEHGYHQDSQTDPKGETRVVNALIALQPDLLLVGMGSPKQEAFIVKLKQHLPKTIMIGVGGSLDVWAGTVARAPKWMSDLHLEWLYRMIRQPARFRRFPMLLSFARRVIMSSKQ